MLVAETLQQAQHAASLVRITYEPATPVVETENAVDTIFDPAEFFGEKLAVKRGDAAAALHRAEVQHEAKCHAHGTSQSDGAMRLDRLMERR